MDGKQIRSEKPLGVAMVICERVITEAVTSNKTLVSTFNRVSAKEFPCRFGRMSVYVALTNGNGKKPISLQFKHGETKILEFGGEVIFDNPNHVIELIFNLKNVGFPKPGLYSFEVFADGEYIFESRFSVVEKEKK